MFLIYFLLVCLRYYESIFCYVIFKPANINIMWIRECRDAGTLCCGALADFFTPSVIFPDKFFLEKSPQIINNFLIQVPCRETCAHQGFALKNAWKPMPALPLSPAGFAGRRPRIPTRNHNN